MGVLCKDEAETAEQEAPITGEAEGDPAGIENVGVMSGVAGAEDEGEAASTIHNRCALVATTFDTTCESDCSIFTQNTGQPCQ